MSDARRAVRELRCLGTMLRVALGAAIAVCLAACAFSPASERPASAGARPRANAPIVRPEAPPPAPVNAPPPITYAPPEAPASTAPLRAPAPPEAVAPPASTPSVAIGAPAGVAGEAPRASFGPAPPEANVAGAADSVAKSTPLAAPPGLKIALVLPVESAVFGSAAEAVAAGFNAAAEAAQVHVALIGHREGEVLDAFAKARAAGATVIVGPLVRDDLKALAASGEPLPWTIALNQLEDGTPLPDRVYTLTLSIDSEGRQIARRLQSEGAHDVAIVATDSGLQRRFAASFTSEWVRLGGAPPRTLRLVRSADSLVALRTEIARMPVDAVLLAADAADAAAAKPFLGHVTVYASSQVDERQPREIANDLDGVRFIEVPWLAEGPDAFPDLPPREFPDTVLDRLYALGFDACHVALGFADGPPQRLEVDGATGHLSLAPDHRIVREGRLMQLESGRPVPVEGP